MPDHPEHLHPDDEPKKAKRKKGPQYRLEGYRAERLARLHPKDKDDSRKAPGPPPDFFPRRMREYRKRQRRHLEPRKAGRRKKKEASADDTARAAPPAPPEPVAATWIPIGPSVVRQGQVSNRTATAGRIAGLAVARGRIYAAAANGGVWRSDDGAATWRSTMDAWDLDPTTSSSDTLACGAIAVDQADPDRVYVGTGEGATLDFLGVGPVVSDDGGTNWATEPATPSLEGRAFYELAVDPGDRDNVVGATNVGLYRREPGAGGFTWDLKEDGEFTSVVAGRGAIGTIFYAARAGGDVFRSLDGGSWLPMGTGFPGGDVGRISLGVAPGSPDVAYALVADALGDLLGVWRLDFGTGDDASWREVSGAPDSLFNGLGWYAQSIAVDPSDEDRIYLGGASLAVEELPESDPDRISGALYRCDVTSSGSGAGFAYSMESDPIGATVHADIHALVFTPRDSRRLWVGCDGGVFHTAKADGGAVEFTARNTGLATLAMEHLAQHPSEDAVLFCGTQDNGTLRFTGEEAWLHMAPGDGGYSVVNWASPYRVIATFPYSFEFLGAPLQLFVDGGNRYTHRTIGADTGDPALFYYPLAGTPPSPKRPPEAARMAFGTTRPWLSDNFGYDWGLLPGDAAASEPLGSDAGFVIRSLAFASFSRLYAGTMNGRVYLYDETVEGWTCTRIDDLGLPDDFAVPVTDIAVDPADASGDSIYITFGGLADYRRVWHWDGSAWSARSGPGDGSPASLLDVQHNAVAVDPDKPKNVYVGADIGCWRSTDAGSTWAPFSEGLPDASVVDLLIAPRHLLRASTFGRGVFERRLDHKVVPPVELYVRDTQLDQGRFPTVDGLDHPADRYAVVKHWRGPDSELETPDAAGRYQYPDPGGSLDFYEFVDKLPDEPRGVAFSATPTTETRVHVQVHNRGVRGAGKVRVMLLVANASGALPALPAGYAANVRDGTPITTPDWRTAGVATLDGVRAGYPEIATFALGADLLPPPANLTEDNNPCVLALVHHEADPYVSTETRTDVNTLEERKAAHKNLKVVQFVGSAARPLVVPVRLHNVDPAGELSTGLLLRLGRYQGRVRLYVPPLEFASEAEEPADGLSPNDDFGDFDAWADEHLGVIEAGGDAYDKTWTEQRIDDVTLVRESGSMYVVRVLGDASLRRFVLPPASYRTVFLMLDRPRDVGADGASVIEVRQLAEPEGETIGGLDVRVEMVSG